VLADVTGDGETPRDDNNNRAWRSLLYEPIRVVTRLENGEWVVEVIYAGEGVESPRVERSGALSGPWILIPIPRPVGEKVEIRLPLDSAQQFLRAVPGP
jgi:hypothetical protein